MLCEMKWIEQTGKSIEHLTQESLFVLSSIAASGERSKH